MSPFLSKSTQPVRRFHNTRATLTSEATDTSGQTSADEEPNEFHPGFPKLSPDFSLVVRTPGQPSRRWVDRWAFVEVKPTRAEGPKKGSANPNEALVQATDYARVFLSTHPFLLFCVGLLICGSDFCVALFDRDGIVLSDTFNLWQDTAVFVKIVRRLCCHLSDNDLGMDPTVHLLPPSVKRRAQDTGYPMYVIDPIGVDNRTWCTVGPPLWSSLSMLGRGTVVWRVVPFANGELMYDCEMVLKSAWRLPDRTSESDIYKLLGPIEGLARFVTGADVRAPSEPDCVISVQWLQKPSRPKTPNTTPILHRLITKDVGRPIWDYDDDLELLHAMRSILAGPRF